MPRPNTIINHPRRREIEESIRSGRPVREIAHAFGLSPSAVQRHKLALVIDQPGNALSPTANPRRGHASGGTGKGKGAPTRPVPARPIETVHAPKQLNPVDDPMEEADPFDLLGMNYPWPAGAPRTVDPLAHQLRDKQRRYGSASIRQEVLDLVSDTKTLSDALIARKLDVPVHMIAEWRAIRLEEIRAGMFADPTEDAVRQLAEFDRLERHLNRALDDPNASPSTKERAADRLMKLHRQRHERKEALGLIRPLPPQSIPVDERGLPHVLSMRADLAEIMCAAGVDPHTPWEDAAEEFGRVLDQNFGSPGSEGRAELSQVIHRGFRQGREVAGLNDDYEPVELDPAEPDPE